VIEMFDSNHLHPHTHPKPSEADSGTLSQDPLRFLRQLREKHLYIEARELIFELEKWALEKERVWFELEEEKAQLYCETGDWWRALLSLTHLIQNPNSPPTLVEVSRQDRVRAAFEASDYALASQDLSRLLVHPFHLQLVQIQILIRHANIREAWDRWNRLDAPKNAKELFAWMMVRIQLSHAQRVTPSPATYSALVALADSTRNPFFQGRARLEAWTSAHWEPLRMRNEPSMRSYLAQSPRLQRLLDEISSPGLDLFRSTASKSLIENLNRNLTLNEIELCSTSPKIAVRSLDIVYDCTLQSIIPLSKLQANAVSDIIYLDP